MKKIKGLSLLILLTSIFFVNFLNEAYATVTVKLSDSAGSDAFNVTNSLQEVLVLMQSDGKVAIGTITPSATLHIVGSSTVSSVALKIKGTTTVTIGNFGIGTTTPNTALYVIGTVTSSGGFIGDGSQLTNIPAGGADSINSSTISDGSITLADLATNIDFVTTGTLSVSSGNFKVDSSGSMTASAIDMPGFDVNTTGSMTATAITSTGSITASGNMLISGTVTATGFIGDGSQLTNIPTGGGAGSVNSTTILDGAIALADLATNIDFVTTGTLSVSSGNFVVDSNGSMTASGTITVAGIVAPASGDLSGSYPSPSVVDDSHIHTGASISALSTSDFTSVNISNWTNDAGYITPSGDLSVTGSITVANNLRVSNSSFIVNNSGSLTASNITSTGSITASGNLTVGTDVMFIDSQNNNVGIGTITPAAKLHVTGTTTITGGFVGIGTTTPSSSLHVVGTATVSVLKITGGSDLAEPFDIGGSQFVGPGMVVCIDPQHTGKLIVSDKAYDSTVAGIISGANGIKSGLTMMQKGSLADGELPVALTGRVYCLADASNGEIQPGDLLTTSNTLGHSMKVTDYTKAQGAIIGKAMSHLKHGKGMVLVLVSLQ